jgi:uncharacterized protein
MEFSDVVLAAVGLLLVFEGLMPFLIPAMWRETMRQVMALSDGQLRFIGLVSILIGAALLLFIKQG